MGNKGGMALGFGLFVLLAAIAVPAAITASNGELSETATITQGDTAGFDDTLEVTNEESTAAEVTIIALDSETGERKNVTIQEGNTADLSFQGGTVSITAVDTTNNEATLLVEYPSTFGYSNTVLVIRDNLPLILTSMVLIGVMGFLGVMKP